MAPEVQTILNELAAIEMQHRRLAERSYQARKQLERFFSPAPSGGKGKKGLDPAIVAKIRDSIRKPLHKKAI